MAPATPRIALRRAHRQRAAKAKPSFPAFGIVGSFPCARGDLEMAGCGCKDGLQGEDLRARRALWIVLFLNATMFFVEGIAGWLAESTGLLADALDMFADAAVYAIALWAVGRHAAHKRSAAVLSGWLQLILGLSVLADVMRRLIMGSQPEPPVIGIVGMLALAVNVAALLLLQRHREGGIHLRASWIFTKNDVIANLAVLAAGGLVAWTGSRLPDLLVGFGIAALVCRGGYAILKAADADKKRSCIVTTS
ncbi:MAG: cation transporter [Rhodocyclaceae bacterium]|nr:cation transporter [Rhodocyclaceae bacterium]